MHYNVVTDKEEVHYNTCKRKSYGCNVVMRLRRWPYPICSFQYLVLHCVGTDERSPL